MTEYIEINSNEPLKLSKIPTLGKVKHSSKKRYKEQFEKNRDALEEHQVLLYAGQARAMLIIFQGMDTSGKDGAIKHVMSGVNPQGCQVYSFKKPSPEELGHDFLWRVNRAMPERGKIGIFNRSYYEEVLITRVHPKLLLDQKLPTGSKHNNSFWMDRYSDIVNHEKFLHRQGYEIVKIFIHISKDEQKRRLMERFDDPTKQWKISEGDIEERSFWKEYQSAYEECLANTSSKHIPWYIVPGDDKENARLIISEILVKRFKQMGLEYPTLSSDQKKKLKKMKASLSKD